MGDKLQAQERPVTTATPQSFNLGLPRKLTAVVFSFYMAFLMSLAMCFIIVGVNSGVGNGYILRVLEVWRFAMPSAFVIVMIVRPLVLKLVLHTVRAH
jgi:hypothetical protein